MKFNNYFTLINSLNLLLTVSNKAVAVLGASEVDESNHYSSSTRKNNNLRRSVKAEQAQFHTSNSTTIECTYHITHPMPLGDNDNDDIVQPNQHCITDSGIVYSLGGLTEENLSSDLLESGHTRLTLADVLVDNENHAVHIDDPSSLIIRNDDNREHRQLTKTGDQRVLVVIVTDRSGNRPVQNEAQMANDVFLDSVNLRERFAACSKNQLRFVPASGSRVNNGVVTVQTSTRLNGVSYGTCGNLARAVLPGGISYNHVMFVCPDVVNFGQGAAWGTVGGQFSWYPSRHASSADVMVHELGHNLGWSHSGTNTAEYDDGTCHMGNRGGFRDESLKFCFNAAKTYYSNWFPEYATTIRPESNSFRGNLVGIDDVVNSRSSSNAHRLTVRIAGNSEIDLFMIYNRRKGVNGQVPADGDRVHIVRQSGLSGKSTRVAALTTGEVYTDSNWARTGRNLKVRVCRRVTSGQADVASVIVYLEGRNDINCDSNPTPTPAPTPPSPTPTPGYSRKFVLINPQTGKALDVDRQRCDDGTNIHLWDRNDTPAQIFHYHYASRAIINVKCNKAVDISAANCNRGTNIQLWRRNGTGAQQFLFYTDQTIRSALCLGKGIDIYQKHTASGTNIWLYDLDSAWDKKWRFIYV